MTDLTSTASLTLRLIDDYSAASGRVTFYSDSRAQRSQTDRRQCRDRRRSIRFTLDRRGLGDRRKTTMSWDQGYHFKSDTVSPIDLPRS